MPLISIKNISPTIDSDNDSCIHKWFEAQVQCNPDAVAVVCDDKQLTYQELNTKANQLAHHLQAQKVKPDVLVGICLERSLEMVVGLLGILKTGGAYVSLDPAYPKERLSFIMEETQVPLLLTQKRLVEQLPQQNAPLMCLDTDWEAIARESKENPVSEVKPHHLAYAIFTSGSTGNPKGVQITQGNVGHYVRAMSEALSVQADDVYLHTASFSFSSSVRQLMVPLSQGATVVIATAEQVKNPLTLFDVIKQYNVTIIDIVPSYWRTCTYALANIDSESRTALLDNKLRLILSASAPLSSDIPKNWRLGFQPNVNFINMFGQTETTGIVAVYPIPDEYSDEVTVIPIGQPIANTQIHLLDDDLAPVPVGALGEMYISGAGLGRGYLNRPDLTEAKFLPNPFSDEPEARLYKTGDLGRYRPDGIIEFVGRIDYQVKIRGMRVELGEIELVLAQHPGVRETVIIARDDLPGEKRLVAYVVPKLLSADSQQTICTKELRCFLKEKLPDYMVPSAFVILATLPLTPNGKVDRRALPEPDQVQQEQEETFVAPQNELELQLTKMWEKVLDVKPIGVKDNFFELGGDSLQAIRLLSEVEKFSGKKNLSISTLFEAPTIEQQATLLRQQDGSAPWRSLVMIRPGSTKPPLFCIHAAWGTVLFYQKLARYLEPDQPFYALQARGVDSKQVPHTSISEMAAHYIEEIQTVQPEGPYFIGGYSFGGLVAFEIARQLHAQGQEIALLALIDIAAPGYHKPTSISDDGQPSTFRDRILFHLRKLLRLSIQDQLSYLWERLGWHLTIGKLSLFYKSYLRYVRQSPQDARILDVAEVNNQAARSYVPPAYPGRLTLFRATDKSAGFGNDPDMGWSKLATGGVKIYEISGSHKEIIEEPQVKGLAEKLKLCLKATKSFI